MKRRKRKLFSLLLVLISIPVFLHAQTEITGVVTEATSGDPLPGVNVVVEGTSIGTITDVEGNFSIQVEDPEAVLVFSYVGFITENISLGGETYVEVTLVPDILSLDELVVVGYGTQKKSDLTGSVAVVNTENLAKIESADIAKVLQGQTAGVQVFGGGEPGAVQQVQIRGIGTFGKTEPLYVIDGVPIAPATKINISGQSLQFEDRSVAYGAEAPAGGIMDFNPSDIESVQVLKDASAAAIYGARGANGVIIITTKRGKSGEMKVNYEGSYGWQNIMKSNRLELTNREQFQELNNVARTNDGGIAAPVNNPESPMYIDSIDTDWQEETFKWGHITKHNLSIQGGSESSSYYGSVSYFDQTGTVVGNGPRYTKYGVQLNLDQKKGIFKFGQSFMYSSSDQIRLTSSRWNNYVMELAQAIPTVQIYDTANIGGFGGSSNQYLQIAGNPIAFNSLKEVKFKRKRFMGVVFGEVEFFKGFSYRLNLSYDRADWHNTEWVPVYNVGNRHTWNYAIWNEWRGENPTAVMENLLNFQRSFGKHDITAVLGYTAQKDHIADIYAHAEWDEGFLGPYNKVISGVSSGQNALGKRFEHTMISYLGRVNYAYDDRYLVTGSFRRDYSSNFGPNNKYGDFPSFALGWKLSNEPFFDVPFITLLKFRGGWGKIGNERIDAYLYEVNVNNAVNSAFGQTLYPGTTQTYFTDPSIRWEERITTNIGFDMALWQNKIEFSAEYYLNKANDILMPFPIPISSGAVGWSIPAANGASMINKGVEINFSYKDFEGDFHYEISGNITTLNNEVTKLGTTNLPVERATSKTEVGRSAGELYGYLAVGIFDSPDQINNVLPDDPAFDPNRHAFQHVQTQPGDVMFADINGDGQITTDDRTYLGVAIPKFTYGLNASFEYKGFDLSIFFVGVQGNKVYNDIYKLTNQLGEGNYSIESYNNYWRDDYHSTSYPRPTVTDNNGNQRVSSLWVQDGSYFRLQNLILGYTIPFKALEKTKVIDNLRIYVQAQNLFTITKLYGWDPDFVSEGIFDRGFSSGSYPTPTTFLIGVKLGL